MQIVPKSNSRTVIVGKTGTGKTTFAAWILSQSNLSRPGIILDYKREILFEQLRRSYRINVQTRNFHRPSRGLELLRPRPQVDVDEIEAVLWEMWRKGNCLIFIDEALHLPANSRAMVNIMAQGRSKNIQVITCVQRPYYVSPFLISEASYYGIFRLTDKRDQDRIREFIPLEKDYLQPPDHYCYWYNDEKSTLSRLQPLDDVSTIIPDIASQLPARVW
jgi:DNA helicase HerA-like ATPase